MPSVTLKCGKSGDEPPSTSHGDAGKKNPGPSVKQQTASFGVLLDKISKECKKKGIWSDALHRDLPKRWEKHGDMILLPDNSFRSPEWRYLGREVWVIVAESFQVERVGRKRRISPDDYRSPHVELLYGKDGWVEHIDNKIRYQYDVTKCMFSIGNIGEKIRIAEFCCKGETVVDMFVGIGYFTLPYLVHAKAEQVYAIDWNPDAIQALRRNLEVNKVSDRCTVIEGDCRKVCPAFVADRVNLGLLPTAKQYWLTGAKALKASGGRLHIHDTITAGKFLERKASLPVPSRASKPPLPKQASLSQAEGFINLQTPAQNGSTGNTHENTRDNQEKEEADCSGAPRTERSKVLMNGCSKEALRKVQEESIPRRKLSRAASIVEEIESKEAREPVVEEEKWDKLDPAWRDFSLEAGRKITGYLNNLHEDLNWQCKIVRIGKIKSYAPHIDHVVLDLECFPVTSS